MKPAEEETPDDLGGVVYEFYASELEDLRGNLQDLHKESQALERYITCGAKAAEEAIAKNAHWAIPLIQSRLQQAVDEADDVLAYYGYTQIAISNLMASMVLNRIPHSPAARAFGPWPEVYA